MLSGTIRQTAGLPIYRTKTDALMAEITPLAETGKSVDIHFITAHAVSIAEVDPHYRAVLSEATILLPDGRWLDFLTRFSSAPLHQVRGPDLFRALLAENTEESPGHFFVAPSNHVASRLLEAVQRDFPTARIAGHFVAPEGPFSADQFKLLVSEIRRSGRPIVWLGIGTPAQNFLANRLVKEDVGIVIGVGAAFEFVAGTKSEAPRWLSTIGFEWLYRLATEPRRLWHRYTVGNVRFLIAFFRGERRREVSQSIEGTVRSQSES
jgi:N-acetylglucosaminyldiphosphoundecaprenol N-acetyl-beta-D-mannosaminyltransferase